MGVFRMQKRLWKMLALLLCAAMVLALTFVAAQAEEKEPAGDAKTEFFPDSPEKAEKPRDTRGATRGPVYSDEPLIVGQNSVVIENGGDYVYRPFTPDADGVYKIYSTGDNDTCGYLEDENGMFLDDDDDGGEGYNFSLRAPLTAGVTYKVRVEYWSSTQTGTIPVTIERYPVNACGDNLFWSLDKPAKKLTITGSGEMWNYEEPEDVPWYFDRAYIQSAALPAGIRSIGDYAFCECEALKGITIPSGVTYIGRCAFFQCHGIKSVVLPDGMKTVATLAFANCSELQSVKIPATVNTFGAALFDNCEKLLSENVQIDPANEYYEISDGALISTDGTLFICFFCADPRTRYTVPDSVEYIHDGAFMDCAQLQLIVVPNTVEDIGSWAFYGCRALDTMRLPDGLNCIDERMFSYCEELNWIVIPKRVTGIEYYAFSGCGELGDVYYTGTEEQKDDMWIGGSGNDELTDAEWHCDTPATRTVQCDPNGGTPVAPVTFRTGDVAPRPENPTRDGFVFVGWVPETSATGELYSFEYPELYDVSLRAKWSSNKCGDDLYWSFDRESGKLTITGTGAMYEYMDWHKSPENGSPWWDIRDEITSVALPSGMTSIGDFAFQDCNGFSSIALPSTLKWIGHDAFYSCDGLTSVTVPDSVTSIMPEAFIYCEKLKTVKLGKNVEYIGDHAFYECEKLESITIPAKTWDIGSGAFAACQSLTGEGVKVDPNNDEFTVKDGALFHRNEVLHTCLCGEPRTSYTVPDGVKFINVRAFESCVNLTSVSLPEGVTRILFRAFEDCFRLEWIVLPKTVTEIDTGAFYGCDALTDVYYTGTEQDRGNIYISPVGAGPASDNLPLLAATWHYVKAYYAVTFDSDGGSPVNRQQVRVMSQAMPPVNPTKLGYRFLGWYRSGKAYDFTAPILSNITLTAKWQKITALKGTVEFNKADVKFNGATPYVVFNGTAQKPRVIVKDQNGKTVAASKYTVTYRNNAAPGTAYADVTMKDGSGFASLWFKIYLPPTASTTVANTNDGIQISWKAVSGAKGYVIYRRAWNLKSSGWTTFERWNNTTKTTWTDTKVYAGTRYQYGVKAYFSDPMDNYNLGIVGPLKTTVRITTRKLTGVTPGSKKLGVKWEGSALFTGYQVQVATDAKFTQNVKTVTIDKAKTYQTVVTGLKAKTTYFVRVRSYHIFDGTTYYGGWSNVLTGKTK